jgi:hypothetical protein
VWFVAWALQRSRRWVKGVFWLLVVIGVVIPTISQATLFPYNYTWLNGITASKPIDGLWSTDYWRQSGRELISRTPAGVESCRYEQFRKSELHACSQEPMFTPYLEQRASQAKSATLAAGEYWLIWENQGVTDIPAGCELFDQISRRLFLQTVVIGQIAKCKMKA